MALVGTSEVQSHIGTALVVVLDLSISRIRAVATRFHMSDAPLLIVLSPHGIIESRDEAPFDDALVLKRLADADRLGRDLDGQLAELDDLVAAHPTDSDLRMKLIAFLISHRNAKEAIPHLTQVRTSAEADLTVRIQATVAEAQAHFWIAEPEKGRHVAEDMIATVGEHAPEARCAGYFALGAQDVLGRHHELGLRELDQAIAIAPDSPYGKRAQAERAKFPADVK